MKTILSCAIGFSALLCAAACQSPANDQESITDAALARKLAPELANARALSVADLAVDQRRDFTAARDLGFRFERDLNGDGNRELLLVGDYGAIDSRRTFALIASTAAHGWSRTALFEFPEKFIVGVGHPDGVSLGFCLNCDHGGSITWTGTSYKFDWHEPGP